MASSGSCQQVHRISLGLDSRFKSNSAGCLSKLLIREATCVRKELLLDWFLEVPTREEAKGKASRGSSQEALKPDETPDRHSSERRAGDTGTVGEVLLVLFADDIEVVQRDSPTGTSRGIRRPTLCVSAAAAHDRTRRRRLQTHVRQRQARGPEQGAPLPHTRCAARAGAARRGTSTMRGWSATASP